jgi:hypothetical protein
MPRKNSAIPLKALRELLGRALEEDQISLQNLLAEADPEEPEQRSGLFAQDVATESEAEQLAMRLARLTSSDAFDLSEHQRDALRRALRAIEDDRPIDPKEFPIPPSQGGRSTSQLASSGAGGYQARYLPFRYRRFAKGAWGIEIVLYYVVIIGRALRNLGLSPQDALNVAHQYMWHHEIFHFRVERAIEMYEAVQENSRGHDFYALGFRLKTRHLLEEALAEARAIYATKLEFRRARLSPHKLANAMNYLESQSLLLPPGYSSFKTFLRPRVFGIGCFVLMRLYLYGVGIPHTRLRNVPREAAVTLRLRDSSYPEMNTRGGVDVPVYYY